jgi:hypothetical protein
MGDPIVCRACGGAGVEDSAAADSEPATIPVRIGQELFRWESYQRWVNLAARQFRMARAGGDLPPIGGYLCIDAGGMVCEKGSDFMAARDHGRFPVRVIRLAQYEPAERGEVAP